MPFPEVVLYKSDGSVDTIRYPQGGATDVEVARCIGITGNVVIRPRDEDTLDNIGFEAGDIISVSVDRSIKPPMIRLSRVG